MLRRFRPFALGVALTTTMWMSAPAHAAAGNAADPSDGDKPTEARDTVEAEAHESAEADASAAQPVAVGPGLEVIIPLIGGGLLLAGGALVGLMASTDEQNLVGLRHGPHRWEDIEDLHARAETKATTANALYGAGGLAVGVGLVLWLAADTPDSVSIRMTPGGIVLRGGY